MRWLYSTGAAILRRSALPAHRVPVTKSVWRHCVPHLPDRAGLRSCYVDRRRPRYPKSTKEKQACSGRLLLRAVKLNSIAEGDHSTVAPLSLDHLDKERLHKHAISTVLSLIATQRLDDLAGLVKREAVNRFVQEVSQQLGYGNMHYLKEVDDIVAMPHKVALQSIVDQKYCDIQVNFIVMKNLDNGQSSPDIPRVFVCFILAKFHRNYTAGVLPDWTITDLSLLRTSSLLR
ncbi:uncharacterized protein [Dermacentor andersoni]|uniref:uncharacterized protein isoform X1 n=1 Tax=Dermacentor andersoni TaxID=34620 RepID=UPI002417A163|nr:uncharacterized protein LOC126539567 isoform X1 [Dermacentor andersoni]